MVGRSATSTLFPYTTLFRSMVRSQVGDRGRAGLLEGVRERTGLALDRGTGGGAKNGEQEPVARIRQPRGDRKSTRLNSSHANISYAVFCLKKKIHAPTTPNR